MAENERQHYVPQFLLRNFSKQKGSGYINLYNTKHNKLVLNAAIKTQAQEKYYYGVDSAYEKFFAHIENRIAPVIKEIVATNTLIDRNNSNYKYLLHFVTLFAFRTKAYVDKMQEQIDSAFKEVAKQMDQFKDIDLGKDRIIHPEPAAYMLAKSMDNWVITVDLDPFLLINETDDEFVISDNPLVIHNPMMQKRGQYAIATGLINKGLLLFFPVSPKHCLMLIDPWAYDVYCSGNISWVNNIGDVNSINLLQSLSADQNIFFANPLAKDAIIQTGLESIRYKINKPVNKVVDHPSKLGTKVLLTYHVQHEQNPPLSFIRESKEALQYKCSEHTNHVRNQALSDWIRSDKSLLRNK